MFEVKSYLKEDKVFIMEDLSRMTVEEYRLAIKEHHKNDNIKDTIGILLFLGLICSLIYAIIGVCMGW